MTQDSRTPLTFKRATEEHMAARSVSPTLERCIRRILERDPTMAEPPRIDGDELTLEEQHDLLVELIQSVDQNAHLRGKAEGRQERSEELAEIGAGL
jgi:hypothetical protein